MDVIQRMAGAAIGSSRGKTGACGNQRTWAAKTLEEVVLADAASNHGGGRRLRSLHVPRVALAGSEPTAAARRVVAELGLGSSCARPAAGGVARCGWV